MILVIIGIVFGVFAFGCVCHALLATKKKRWKRASELVVASVPLAVGGIFIAWVGLQDPSKFLFEYKDPNLTWTCGGSTAGSIVCVKNVWAPGNMPAERPATAK